MTGVVLETPFPALVHPEIDYARDAFVAWLGENPVFEMDPGAEERLRYTELIAGCYPYGTDPVRLAW
ncbi:hypothetical protein [Amycolatopsis sp. GM8]|uniref:hypothetical protein n=1 Tax=Amycolatopsis sp. GM8 TaxID=2896530 RepID=UPI001F1665A4|nr:hypothetical protein [Amycolatopsis sp. GM8]